MTDTSASKIFDLRKFYYYQSGNTFTGSLNNFNYKITPEKNIISAEIWHGKLCSELAEIELKKEFQLDEKGFDEMIRWLEEEYKKQEK